MNGNCSVENVMHKSPPHKSQKNMFTLALLNVIGNRATAITP